MSGSIHVLRHLNSIWSHFCEQSRRHWLSAVQFRKNWMVGYLVFNAFLYTVQVLLYSLLFIPSVDQVSSANLKRSATVWLVGDIGRSVCIV